MTIVPLIRRSDAASGLWQSAEMSQLLSIYAAYEAQGEAAAWDTGETERQDPQFYILDSSPAQDCVASITRIGRDYVLEDGHGRLVAEGRSLSMIADRAMRMHGGRRSLPVLLRLGILWIAAREFFEERVEPVLAESLETATHVFPPLAALV